MKRTKRLWSPTEIEYLIANFPDTYTQDICDYLGRSYSSVSARAYLMKLHKSEKFNSIELQKQAERLKVDGAKFRFKKDQTPINKGKKMAPEVYEKIRHTMFKKGSIPGNFRTDGSERISKDGYLEIKVNGRWIYKHRYIWKQLNGAINKTDVVRFKDKNPLNCTIENLELVSQKENMIRNSIYRFPEEIVSTIIFLQRLKD
jgi:hypothetical protein